MSDQERPIRTDCAEQFAKTNAAIEMHTKAAEERTRILEAHTQEIKLMSNKVFNGFGEQIRQLTKRIDKVDARVWAILFSVFGAFASSLATLIFFLIRLGIIGGNQ